MHSGYIAGCIQKSVDSSLCLIGLIVFLRSLMVPLQDYPGHHQRLKALHNRQGPPYCQPRQAAQRPLADVGQQDPQTLLQRSEA